MNNYDVSFYVCSFHFCEDQLTKKKRIKSQAVPTIFPDSRNICQNKKFHTKSGNDCGDTAPSEDAIDVLPANMTQSMVIQIVLGCDPIQM